jgi:hypothetical protein
MTRLRPCLPRRAGTRCRRRPSPRGLGCAGCQRFDVPAQLFVRLREERLLGHHRRAVALEHRPHPSHSVELPPDEALLQPDPGGQPLRTRIGRSAPAPTQTGLAALQEAAVRTWPPPHPAAAEAGGRPVGHAHDAAGPEDAEELGGHHLGPWGEHRPEHRGHTIEAASREGQRLGVGLHPPDGESRGLGSNSAQLEQGRGEVGGHHPGAPAGCRHRAVAVPGGHVQHVLPGPDAAGLDQLVGGWLQQPRDGAVVAKAPDRFGRLFQLSVVDAHGRSLTAPPWDEEPGPNHVLAREGGAA